MCLRFVRQQYNVAARYSNAALAWRNTKYRHTGTPPKGVPVWWTGGSRGFGHVAISDGGGYVISTDVPSKGRVGRIAISSLTRSWGLTYRGWSEDINGVRVYRAAAKVPSVSFSRVRNAARAGRYAPGVLVVQKALRAEPGIPLNYSTGPGWFGPRTKKAYSAWQYKLGFRGRDADGIPGVTSLRRLGNKRGFRVVS